MWFPSQIILCGLIVLMLGLIMLVLYFTVIKKDEKKKN